MTHAPPCDTAPCGARLISTTPGSGGSPGSPPLIARVYQLQSLSRGALVPRYRKGTALLPRFVRHGAPESPASREVALLTHRRPPPSSSGPPRRRRQPVGRRRAVRLRSCGGAQLLRRVRGRRRERTLSCPILYMMLPCTDACAWSTRSRCVICAAHTRPHHPSVWRAAQHYGRSRASRMACATAVCDLGRNGKRQSAKRTIPSVSSHCCACAGQNSPSTPRSRARSRIAGRRRAPSSDLPASGMLCCEPIYWPLPLLLPPDCVLCSAGSGARLHRGGWSLVWQKST